MHSQAKMTNGQGSDGTNGLASSGTFPHLHLPPGPLADALIGDPKSFAHAHQAKGNHSNPLIVVQNQQTTANPALGRSGQTKQFAERASKTTPRQVISEPLLAAAAPAVLKLPAMPANAQQQPIHAQTPGDESVPTTAPSSHFPIWVKLGNDATFAKSDPELVSLLHDPNAMEWVAAEKLTDESTSGLLKCKIFPNKGSPAIIQLDVTKHEILPRIELVQNPTQIQDLVHLPHLNEPSVLEILRKRYYSGLIYSACGGILVAVNPWKELQTYGKSAEETLQQYMKIGQAMLSQIENNPGASVDDVVNGKLTSAQQPHIFSVARSAYVQMLANRNGQGRDGLSASNQSILVSGDSGAGKTESTKLLMRYLAQASGTTHSHIENAVTESNPLLEAFGNAMTRRNDNSSRFGKFVEIQYDGHGKLIGAKIETYLLESSRCVAPPEAERNFHILYQLCSAAITTFPSFMASYGLAAPEHFVMLSGQQSNGTVFRNEDAQAFNATLGAFKACGLTEESKEACLRMLAAMLHLGNVQIQADSEGNAIVNQQTGLSAAAILLQVEEDSLRNVLTQRGFKAGADTLNLTHQREKACDVLDALCKSLYSKVFGYIVETLNKAIDANVSAAPQAVQSTVGILDIYGFEQFESNHWEQFVINYVNEKLQSLFNAHNFSIEVALYAREGVNWDASTINSEANEPTLLALEGKGASVLSIIEEQSILPQGSDDGILDQIGSTLSSDRVKLARMASAKQFVVCHYASDVAYSVKGFLEKNRDTLIPSILQLFSSSKDALLKSMYGKSTAQENQASGSPFRSRRGSTVTQTVMSGFKTRLQFLVNNLEKTQLHFVRCINSNPIKASMTFNQQFCLAQLRCSGVIEALRVTRSRFASRMQYQTFLDRYWMLVPANMRLQAQAISIQQQCVFILSQSAREEKDFAIGKTLVFIKQPLQERLEKQKQAHVFSSVITVQRYLRMGCAQRSFRLALGNAQRLVRVLTNRWQARKERLSYCQMLSQARNAEQLARDRFELERQRSLVESTSIQPAATALNSVTMHAASAAQMQSTTAPMDFPNPTTNDRPVESKRPRLSRDTLLHSLKGLERAKDPDSILSHLEWVQSTLSEVVPDHGQIQQDVQILKSVETSLLFRLELLRKNKQKMTYDPSTETIRKQFDALSKFVQSTNKEIVSLCSSLGIRLPPLHGGSLEQVSQIDTVSEPLQDSFKPIILEMGKLSKAEHGTRGEDDACNAMIGITLGLASLSNKLQPILSAQAALPSSINADLPMAEGTQKKTTGVTHTLDLTQHSKKSSNIQIQSLTSKPAKQLTHSSAKKELGQARVTANGPLRPELLGPVNPEGHLVQTLHSKGMSRSMENVPAAPFYFDHTQREHSWARSHSRFTPEKTTTEDSYLFSATHGVPRSSAVSAGSFPSHTLNHHPNAVTAAQRPSPPLAPTHRRVFRTAKPHSSVSPSVAQAQPNADEEIKNGSVVNLVPYNSVDSALERGSGVYAETVDLRPQSARNLPFTGTSRIGFEESLTHPPSVGPVKLVTATDLVDDSTLLNDSQANVMLLM